MKSEEGVLFLYYILTFGFALVLWVVGLMVGGDVGVDVDVDLM